METMNEVQQEKRQIAVWGRTFIFRIEVSEVLMMRFLSRVEFPDPEDDKQCWTWQGCSDWRGYGRFSVGYGKMDAAHRFSYYAFVGDIPEDFQIHHKCVNPACVNPDHLEPKDQVAHLAHHASDNSLIQKGLSELCPRGLHLLSGDNLYEYTEGVKTKRRCRACFNEWSRNKEKRRRAEALVNPEMIDGKPHCVNGHLLDHKTAHFYRGFATCRSCPPIYFPFRYRMERTHCTNGHTWIPGQRGCAECHNDLTKAISHHSRKNATHCTAGHAYEQFAIYGKDGQRKCKECLRLSLAKRYAKTPKLEMGMACKCGLVMTEENSKYYVMGGRKTLVCTACKSARAKRYYEKKVKPQIEQFKEKKAGSGE